MTHLADTTTTHDAGRRAEPVGLDHVTFVPVRHGANHGRGRDRRPPAIRSVTMGPGGWVSLKGMPVAPMRSGAVPSWPW